MLAQFIQHLTLFAFTAHAVLGCCLHHTHAFHVGDCFGFDGAAGNTFVTETRMST